MSNADKGPFFREGTTIYSKQEQTKTRTNQHDWCNLTTIYVNHDPRTVDGKIASKTADELDAARDEVAAFVHVAVNAHADLVAALKSARAAIDDMLRFPDQEPLGEAAIGIIDVALKKAGL